MCGGSCVLSVGAGTWRLSQSAPKTGARWSAIGVSRVGGKRILQLALSSAPTPFPMRKSQASQTRNAPRARPNTSRPRARRHGMSGQSGCRRMTLCCAAAGPSSAPRPRWAASKLKARALPAGSRPDAVPASAAAFAGLGWAGLTPRIVTSDAPPVSPHRTTQPRTAPRAPRATPSPPPNAHRYPSPCKSSRPAPDMPSPASYQLR